MVLGLKAGYLFPNGKMLKEDVMFSYDPVMKAWLPVGQTGMITEPDDTLTNQEGYTDEELAAREANQGTGCNSAAIGGANGGAGMLATVLLLLSSAALAVRRSRTLGK